MDTQEEIQSFLAGAPHAVVGASRDRSKIGNRVLQAYQQTGRPAFPVNPNVQQLDGLTCYLSLLALPTAVHGVSVITPPAVAAAIVEDAAAIGVKHLWFQPGAESVQAVMRAQEWGINVIAGGPCLLVVLGYRG